MSIDVTRENFTSEVLEISENKYILMDFWASWCVPCQKLSPILEEMEDSYNGGFKLVKIDVEQESELALQFQVVNIPNIKLFHKKKVIDQFTGVIPQDMIQKLLDRYIPQDAFSDVSDLIENEEWEKAYPLLIELDNKNLAVQEGLWKVVSNYISFLPHKKNEITELLKKFPETGEYGMYKKALSDFLQRNPNEDSISYLQKILSQEESEVKKGLEYFLKSFQESTLPKEDLLICFYILGNAHPLTLEYRKKLASILY